MQLKQNEKIEDLDYKGLKIIQNKDGFRFGTDAVILSDFAKKNIGSSRVLDIGTGTGIISILLAGKTNARKIVGLDVQEAVCEMASRSVQLNGLEDRVKIVCGDVKNIKQIFDRESFDVVVTNPPYQKQNTGITSDNESEMISRHEVLCNFEDICMATSYVLSEKGEMYVIHRPERLPDIFCSLRKNGLEPKEMRLVEPHLGEKPNLVMIKAVKGGKPFLRIEKALVMYEKDGSCSEEILRIYNRI